RADTADHLGFVADAGLPELEAPVTEQRPEGAKQPAMVGLAVRRVVERGARWRVADLGAIDLDRHRLVAGALAGSSEEGGGPVVALALACVVGGGGVAEDALELDARLPGALG